MIYAATTRGFGCIRDLADDLDDDPATAHGWGLSGSHWQTSEASDDGEALFESIRLAKLEGIVAKKLSQAYRPGERLWVKVKNHDYWRFPLKREAVRKRRTTPSMLGTR